MYRNAFDWQRVKLVVLMFGKKVDNMERKIVGGGIMCK